MENEKISRRTLDIFRWIRPRHIIEIFKDAKKAMRQIYYRYTFTSKALFAVDLLSVPRDIVSSVLNELHSSDLSPTILMILCYENMMTEFRTAWPSLKIGGIFLTPDVGRNDALFDFCKEVNFSWWRTRTYPLLVGLQET